MLNQKRVVAMVRLALTSQVSLLTAANTTLTSGMGWFDDVPKTPVVIEKIERIEE